MRVLTVRQPWAHAIMHLGKDVENRSKATDYRGPLAIHAGLTLDQAAFDRRPFRGLFPDPDTLPRGVIIGVVDLIDCVRDHPSTWAQPDTWHWVLARPRVSPAGHRWVGKMGLVQLPQDVADAVLVDAGDSGGTYSNDR